MEIIDKINNSTNKGTDTGKKYLEASYKYAKLKIFYFSALSITTVLKLFCIGGLVSIALIFLSFAAAIYIGDYFANLAIGYLVIGLFYLILSLIIYAKRKYLEKIILNKMSKIFIEKS